MTEEERCSVAVQAAGETQRPTGANPENASSRQHGSLHVCSGALLSSRGRTEPDVSRGGHRHRHVRLLHAFSCCLIDAVSRRSLSYAVECLPFTLVVCDCMPAPDAPQPSTLELTSPNRVPVAALARPTRR